MKITDSIYLVPGGVGANVYVFLGKEATVLIDTGMGGNASKILEFVKGLGEEPPQIAYIVLTHSDIDHCGNAAQLKALTSAKVAIHKADGPRLSGEQKPKEVKGAMSVLFTIISPFMRFNPVIPDILLEDSALIAGLTVIHTPGHSAGSIALYLPGEVVFVGDALRVNKQGLPVLSSSAMTADVDLAKASVKKLSELNFQVLLPGHGPPILLDAAIKLKEFVANGFQHSANS